MPCTVVCHQVALVASVACMGDIDGLEEFGGFARWRDALLRFPGGHTEPYRVVAMDGHLPVRDIEER